MGGGMREPIGEVREESAGREASARRDESATRPEGGGGATREFVGESARDGVVGDPPVAAEPVAVDAALPDGPILVTVGRGRGGELGAMPGAARLSGRPGSMALARSAAASWVVVLALSVRSPDP